MTGSLQSASTRIQRSRPGKLEIEQLQIRSQNQKSCHSHMSTPSGPTTQTEFCKSLQDNMPNFGFDTVGLPASCLQCEPTIMQCTVIPSCNMLFCEMTKNKGLKCSIGLYPADKLFNIYPKIWTEALLISAPKKYHCCKVLFQKIVMITKKLAIFGQLLIFVSSLQAGGQAFPVSSILALSAHTLTGRMLPAAKIVAGRAEWQ